MSFHPNIISKLEAKVQPIEKLLATEKNNINSPISLHVSTNDVNIRNNNLFEITEQRIKAFFDIDISKLANEKEVKKMKFDLQQDILSYLVHSSDVSNPAKELGVYTIWTKLVMQEFFNQGDLEKAENLPVSYLCDRATTDPAKAQVGFINFIVLPLFKTISFYFPTIALYEANVKQNLEYFKSTTDFSIEYDI